MRAQALVLESVLKNQPLPGMSQAMFIPDLISGTNSDQLILVDDRELDLPAGVRVMRHSELESLTPANKPPQILEFLKPEQFPEKISVRLRHSVFWQDHGYVPSSEIVATFFDRDPLTTTKPTNLVAY